MLTLILLIFAFVLFVVASLNPTPDPWRNKLVCLGLACWVLAVIIDRAAPLLK